MISERDHVLFDEQPNASIGTGPKILKKQVSGLPVSQHGGVTHRTFLGFNPGIELLFYGRISEFTLTESRQSVVNDLSQLLLGGRMCRDRALGVDECETNLPGLRLIGLLG